jgi:hypothetical protein
MLLNHIHIRCVCNQFYEKCNDHKHKLYFLHNLRFRIWWDRSITVTQKFCHPAVPFSFIHSFIHSSMALQHFVGPGLSLNFVIIFTYTIWLLGRVISLSQGRYLHTGQHKHRINARTDIHALSGIRNHNHSVRASEDGSCLRPRDHCDSLAGPLPPPPCHITSNPCLRNKLQKANNSVLYYDDWLIHSGVI